MTWLIILAGMALLSVVLAYFFPEWFWRGFHFVAGKAWTWVKPYLWAYFGSSPETIERAKREAREGLTPGSLKDAPPRPKVVRPASIERPRGGGKNG